MVLMLVRKTVQQQNLLHRLLHLCLHAAWKVLLHVTRQAINNTHTLATDGSVARLVGQTCACMLHDVTDNIRKQLLHG